MGRKSVIGPTIHPSNTSAPSNDRGRGRNSGIEREREKMVWGERMIEREKLDK